MSEKLVLIDGHSILNRAFYGVPDLSNSEGLHTNAIYGFLNILFKLLEEEKPEYLTVAFDVKAPTFRQLRGDTIFFSPIRVEYMMAKNSFVMRWKKQKH